MNGNFEKLNTYLMSTGWVLRTNCFYFYFVFIVCKLKGKEDKNRVKDLGLNLWVFCVYCFFEWSDSRRRRGVGGLLLVLLKLGCLLCPVCKKWFERADFPCMLCLAWAFGLSYVNFVAFWALNLVNSVILLFGCSVFGVNE